MKIALMLLILFITLGVYSCIEVKENTDGFISIKNIEVNYNKDRTSYEDNEQVQRRSGYEEEVVYSDEKRDMLFEVKEEASKGRVIGCEFRAKYDNLASTLEQWGQADENNYVAEAKGQYFIYEKYNIVLGVNKGLQIFEVRTYDKSIGILSLEDIINSYGQPDYDIVTDLDEKIIGYIVNDDFKILLVFKSYSNNKNPMLDHYSVFYPMGTVNLMAEDGSPREW